MGKSPDTAKSIIERGFDIELLDSKFNPDTICELIAMAKVSGSHVLVDASESYSPDSLIRFMEIGHKKLTIRI